MPKRGRGYDGSSYRGSKARRRLFQGGSRGSTQRIKRTILKMAEAKREYLKYSNVQLNHDAGGSGVVGGYGHPQGTVGNNWLGTHQGDSKYQREGDSIYSKYIDYSMRISAKPIWPAQVCRILIVKGTGNNTNDYDSSSIADWFITDGTSIGSGNLITQPVDTTKYTVLKDIIVYPNASGYNRVVADPSDKGDEPTYPVVRGRLRTGYKVQYKTGTTYPSKSSQRIQWAVIPYGDKHALVTDNIASMDVDIVHYFVDM